MDKRPRFCDISFTFDVNEKILTPFIFGIKLSWVYLRAVFFQGTVVAHVFVIRGPKVRLANHFTV